MKKNLTELVFVLDRSGSMAGLENDTIGGFNAMLDKQKEEDGEALVSTVLFDHRREVVYDRVPLLEITPMTRDTYYVRGTTALLDAVGESIRHISNVHKYAREEDRPEKTLFIITTDGMENASKKYDYERVREMIGEKKACGWEFIFLGANIDAAKEAGRFGINPDCAADYHADSDGMMCMYEAVSEAVSCVRASRAIDGEWKHSVDADFKKRKK